MLSGISERRLGIILTELEYSRGDIPVAFLNCREGFEVYDNHFLGADRPYSEIDIYIPAKWLCIAKEIIKKTKRQ